MTFGIENVYVFNNFVITKNITIKVKWIKNHNTFTDLRTDLYKSVFFTVSYCILLFFKSCLQILSIKYKVLQ